MHVLLDGSGSMEWGGESTNGRISELDKWLYARRLAAALGYVTLISGDRLAVANLKSQISNLRFGPVRGRGHALRLFDWLEGLEAEGTTDLNAGLRTYAVSGGRAGLVILISDLFSPAGYAEGLSALAARGHEVAILHVLSPDEEYDFISKTLGINKSIITQTFSVM